MARRPPLGLDPIAEAKRQWGAHGWDAAAGGMTAVTSIMRAHQILLARVDETLKPFRLTFARYELLTLLSFSRGGRMPMASASARLQVHPTSVTNTVDRLEAAGLVTRERNPADGRGVLVSLTEAGRRLAADATGALNAEVFEDVGLAAHDLDDLAGIIARLRGSAGDVVDVVDDDSEVRVRDPDDVQDQDHADVQDQAHADIDDQHHADIDDQHHTGTRDRDHEGIRNR